MDRSEQQAVADRLDRFAAAYLMLSRLLGAPADAELLEQLSTPGMLASWPMSADEPTTRGLDLIAASLSAPEPLADLGMDYQVLFVGPGMPRAVAYESVYGSREHLMFDEQTFQVRQAYQEFGLAAPRLNREPDDHISLELSFLAHLCATALQALDDGDDATVDRCLAGEQAFLDDHVQQWAPQFLASMAEGAQTDFYRGVAALSTGVLAQAGLPG